MGVSPRARSACWWRGGGWAKGALGLGGAADEAAHKRAMHASKIAALELMLDIEEAGELGAAEFSSEEAAVPGTLRGGDCLQGRSRTAGSGQERAT